MLTVNGDRDAVETQLDRGELACPLCGGLLARWGNGVPRRIRQLAGEDGQVRDEVVTPRRSRCRACGATHMLLPVQCLLRRADAAAVIGTALEKNAAGAGHRTIARVLGRPAATVRGWLRRFTVRAEPARAFFTVLLAVTSPDPVMPAVARGPVADAVSAIAGAAAAVAERWPRIGEVPVWAAASAASGGRLLAPGWPAPARNAS